jgi:hypothetical protein
LVFYLIHLAWFSETPFFAMSYAPSSLLWSLAAAFKEKRPLGVSGGLLLSFFHFIKSGLELCQIF